MLKYLTSTTETQGKRKNDFCFVPEGEILKFGFEEDGEDIDGKCGCRRSMVGIDCFKATTTMKVTELNLTEDDLVNLIVDSENKAWGIKVSAEDVKDDVKEIIRIASLFPADTILEKRGNKIGQRSI